ncbi:hypothetical protein LCGC14_0619390 [marine sediment metagenome]|uniref:Uncharacterized protein n=1 Tax=marine sediment metagenome TaxID=412755 RepID=A0A0F9RPN5_9ZZZZ|nr:hypothetical protein [Actinomycetota bacterium]
MKFIVVQRRPEKSIYGSAMYVIASSHDRFTVDSRFDYGFMGIAVEEGYVITVLPLQGAEPF